MATADAAVGVVSADLDRFAGIYRFAVFVFQNVRRFFIAVDTNRFDFLDLVRFAQ